MKRQRSTASPGREPKRQKIKNSPDIISSISQELLIRILHHLPIETLLQCQQVSKHFDALASDSQLWKSLYYTRFVLPRALRIPGIKRATGDEVLFSSRRSKWLDDSLAHRVDVDWKGQYKLRHNWTIGSCGVQELCVAERSSMPSMLVRLADGVIVTASKEGLRAWDLKGRGLVAEYDLGEGLVPTCLAVDEQDTEELAVTLGFQNGSFCLWRYVRGEFIQRHRHPASSNGALDAIAYAEPYLLTITKGHLLSLYHFSAASPSPSHPTQTQTPILLASLRSHSSFPPLCLSLRSTPTTLIASIVYSQPTYPTGHTIGLQELHLSKHTHLITSSRLTSALPPGFHSLSPSPSLSPSQPPPAPPYTSKPTSLAYAHPYILATHPDNTLTLYLCTSSTHTLSISPGTPLYGHTSAVSSASITARGKAVSVSTRGNELRVWELEGGASQKRATERSVLVRTEGGGWGEGEGEVGARKRWVGFDEEVVVVLKETGGAQALMIYDFT